MTTRIRVLSDQLVPDGMTLRDLLAEILREGSYDFLDALPVSPGSVFDADIDSDGQAWYTRADGQEWFSHAGNYEVVSNDQR